MSSFLTQNFRLGGVFLKFGEMSGGFDCLLFLKAFAYFNGTKTQTKKTSTTFLKKFVSCYIITVRVKNKKAEFSKKLRRVT